MQPTCIKDTCESEPYLTRPIPLCVRHAGKVWAEMQQRIAATQGMEQGDDLVTLHQAAGRCADITLDQLKVWATRGRLKTRNGKHGTAGMYAMSDIQALTGNEAAMRPAAHEPVVYYARMADGSIKIGYTADLYTRMTALYARDAVLAIEPGGREVEAQRHARFGDLRIGRAEMFSPHPRLMEHIAAVIREHGIPDLAGFRAASRLRQRTHMR